MEETRLASRTKNGWFFTIFRRKSEPKGRICLSKMNKDGTFTLAEANEAEKNEFTEEFINKEIPLMEEPVLTKNGDMLILLSSAMYKSPYATV